MVRYTGLHQKCKRGNNVQDDWAENVFDEGGYQQFPAYGGPSIFEFWTTFIVLLSPFVFTAVVAFSPHLFSFLSLLLA